ncbi:MFS transporter [Streptomyces sp. NPDC051286]|uniref:MFS transporter n=1 Tax=Streptomyces sp. NPDC051286 TaxID=3365647 RepID=UPI0037990BC8
MAVDKVPRPAGEPERPFPAPVGPVAHTSRARLAIALTAIVLMSELAPMELTLVYPSLRSIALEFHTPHTAWVLVIVGLTAVVTIPLLGKLADTYGKRLVLLALGGLFAAGSVICATATTFPWLLTGRALQGTCGGITAVAYALIRDVFPRRVVPIALGAVSAGIGVSALASPFLAGALIDCYGYRSVFWFMFAYAAVLVPVTLLFIPESPLRLRRRLDVAGVLLLGSGIGLILLALTQGRAWGPAGVVAAGTLGVATLAAFAVWERRVPVPAVDLRLITGSAMRPTLLAALCVGFLIGGYALLMPQMLQTPAMPGLGYGLGLTATGVALWTFPQGLLTMMAGPLGGAVARRFGARVVLIAAGCILTLALATTSSLPGHRWQILLIASAVGVGLGLHYAALPNLVIDATDARHSGVGTAMVPLAGQLGATTAATVMGAVTMRHTVRTEAGTGQIVFTATAYQLSFLIAAAVGLAGVLIAVRMHHGRTPATGGALPDH